MNEPRECAEITTRFFKAIDYIIAQKEIRGVQTFCRLYGINTWNFKTVKKDSLRIKQEWLTYLVRDFGISAKWLLTGIGGMVQKDESRALIKLNIKLRLQDLKQKKNDTYQA